MTNLSVKDLKVNYVSKGKKISAVDGVSLSLENESVGIVGESGCGKTTLGLAIIRSVPDGKVESGEILLDGVSLLSMPEKEFSSNVRWKKISMVFQGAMNSLDPVFSVNDQFEEILKEHGFAGDHVAIINETLDSVGLPRSILYKFPHQLSGGMKQRVVIALALLLKPELVIADEPTTALDVLVQAQILNTLKKLKKNGMAIMLISHDLGIVSEISDKVGVMYAGKIVEFGNLEEVYTKPKHPYTQALLKATPSIRGGSELSTLKGTPPSLFSLAPGCRFYDRCPHAMEKCKKDPPAVNKDGTYVLCWLYEGEKQN